MLFDNHKNLWKYPKKFCPTFKSLKGDAAQDAVRSSHWEQFRTYSELSRVCKTIQFFCCANANNPHHSTEKERVPCNHQRLTVRRPTNGEPPYDDHQHTGINKLAFNRIPKLLFLSLFEAFQTNSPPSVRRYWERLPVKPLNGSLSEPER